MRKYTPAQYKKAAVMVHGKSERFLASYIYTNLHLPVIIIDNNRGKSSIQINGLQKIFNSKPYNNLKSFAETYSIEYDKKDNALKNFKLFIIMDDTLEQIRLFSDKLSKVKETNLLEYVDYCLSLIKQV